MPYRPPLVAFETFVADPPDLPVRAPGETGLSAVVQAEVATVEHGAVTLKGQTSDGVTLITEISAAGEGVIRVRLAAAPDARSRSAAAIALTSPGCDAAARIERSPSGLRLTTGPLVAEISLNPWQLRFLDTSGRLLVEENTGEVDISGRLRTLPFGRSTANGAVVAYHETFTAAADEHFVGLGEKFTAFDKRGQRAVMWNYDAFGAESDRSYKNVPFYLSSRGYGIVVDSGMAIEFDLCQSTHSCVQIVVPDDQLDYYVIAGPTPVEILRRFDRLTCAPLLPPKWAFGSWMSSGFVADTQDSVLDRARRIRARGIGCDVLHLDCYWQVAGHWSDLQWDEDAFPDPTAMFAGLAALGFRTSLWINSYLSRHSPLLAAAEQAGYLLRRPDGTTYIADVWHGSYPACGIVDFTNPDATRWFQSLLRPLLAQGAALFKTDFAEGVPADAVASNGMSGVELHNVYSLLFNDAVAEVTREMKGHSMVWARSSYLGGQRHSAQWGGDTSCTFPAMASTLRGGLSHGLSGVPFWSHDAGGFTGRPSPELYVRWAQFGAFSPLVRFHGTTSRLPWDFPAYAERAVTQAIALRYRLMPYLYTAAVEAARTGAPMMRALLVNSPADPAAWAADLEYRIGPDLLVAPMTDPSGTRSVYLPDGEWVDWWSGEVRSGLRHHTISQPLERVPLFVRRGAAIPVTAASDSAAADTVGDAPFGPITLLCFDVTDTHTVISDVNGDTRITVTANGGQFVVTVDGPAQVEGARPMNHAAP